MCQLKADCPGGNHRCDVDTSEARRNRRKAQALKEVHKSFLRAWDGPPNHKPNSLPPLTPEEMKEAVKEINGLIPNSPDNVMDAKTKRLVSKKLVELGDRVKALAESPQRLYPAPTQEDFDNSFNNTTGLKGLFEGELQDVPTPEELFRWRRYAIIDTLKGLGVEFSEGNLLYARSIKIEEHLAAQDLSFTAKLYPKTWVENSDRAQIEDKKLLHPRGVELNKRLFYTPDVEDNYPKAIQKMEFVEKPLNGGPVSGTKESNEGLTLIEVTSDGKYRYQKKAYQYVRPYKNQKGEVVNPRPAGSGWEQIELHEDDDTSKEKLMYWRRPLLQDTNETVTGTRDVVDNQPFMDKKTRKYASESLAAHEFFHRLTHTNPKLRQMQMAFLHTRAKLGTLRSETKRSVYSYSSNEGGYPKRFNVGYAGREYSDWDNEVGTMGFESLYFGEHGGFVESARNRSDPAYYSFMLGMLATAIK